MKTDTRQPVLNQVANNVIRPDQSGIFYGIFKRKREQVKRGLKTTHPEPAKCRRATKHLSQPWERATSVAVRAGDETNSSFVGSAARGCTTPKRDNECEETAVTAIFLMIP